MSVGLFDGPAPRVRTIPASAPFLDVLVDAILAALPQDDPFALADTVIFLPNRRASSGLVEAFAKKLGGAALLPAIRPLGDLDDDPDVWGPEPLALDVAPEIAPQRRRFELAQLVRRRDTAAGGIDDPVRALAWADELCRLLDAAATVGAIDWGKLDTLVEERDLAAHWRASADFLKIVSTYWPERLKIDGLLDPAQRKAILLERLAAEWTARPPTRPIIIAGSTGSVAATRVLMAAAAALPRGCVVLPGLDTELDEAWENIDAQHPQHAMRVTLEALGVDRRAVAPLVEEETLRAVARRRLISEALVPADDTADWRRRLAALGGAGLIAEAAQGLTVIEARNEDEEALCIALLLREALETPARTAALVTPDATLAHRVHDKLQRWGVTPQMSVAAPLSESEHGVLVSLLGELFVDDASPIALLALLKHPLVSLGYDVAEKHAAIAALERAQLRGPRPWRDLGDLVARLEKKSIDMNSREAAIDAARALPLVMALRGALAPLRDARTDDALDLARLADALAEAAERLATSLDLGGAARLWSGPLGEAAAGVLRDMGDYGGDLGALAARDAPRAVSLLLAAREAPPARGGHPRIAILGPLEARLQRRDLMILGGLVEGVWPGPPPEDAFLSRSMRRGLGLPEPEARTGLAAHDFAQLANAPDVVMTRAATRDGAPTVASRWLWRLETLARATGEKGVLEPAPARDPRRWARALDTPREGIRLRAPTPRPPAIARPQRISFTEVETLIRDPYAVYARRVLGLELLDAPGALADAAQRGTAVHAALEHFADGDDPRGLLGLLDRALADAGFSGVRRRTERARLAASVDAYIAWNSARRAAGIVAYREVRGVHVFDDGRTLSGRADRIDVRPGNVAEVIDFKTGQPPSAAQVNSGLSSQLTLEAAILAKGAFNVDPNTAVPSVQTDALVYWQFGGSHPGETRIKTDADAMQKATEALAALEALLARYANPQQPYLSKPRAQFANTWSDYDHLARRAEWADAEGEG